MRPIISALALLATACSFGFTGGGLPREIKTVAVLDCQNSTADPGIAQFVRAGVKQAVESRLGLRTATEALADAVVRCTVVRYDPDMPSTVTSTPGAAGTPNQVSVTQRMVELTVDLSMVNQKTGRNLWDGRSQMTQGTYNPGRELDGRQKALDLLIKKLIDGVQSNW